MSGNSFSENSLYVMCNKKLSGIPASLNVRQLLAYHYPVFQNCISILYKISYPKYLNLELITESFPQSTDASLLLPKNKPTNILHMYLLIRPQEQAPA